MPAGRTEQAVLAAEAARCAAMAAGDLDALAALLDEDLRYGHTSGLWDTKPQYLGKLRAGTLAYPEMASVPTGFRVVGDLALLWIEVRASVIIPAGRRPMRNAALTVWTRRGVDIRLAAHQPTVLSQI